MWQRKNVFFEGCLDPDGGVLTPDAAVATD
jgi:hypothetical protein